MCYRNLKHFSEVSKSKELESYTSGCTYCSVEPDVVEIFFFLTRKTIYKFLVTPHSSSRYTDSPWKKTTGGSFGYVDIRPGAVGCLGEMEMNSFDFFFSLPVLTKATPPPTGPQSCLQFWNP